MQGIINIIFSPSDVVGDWKMVPVSVQAQKKTEAEVALADGSWITAFTAAVSFFYLDR